MIPRENKSEQRDGIHDLRQATPFGSLEEALKRMIRAVEWKRKKKR